MANYRNGMETRQILYNSAKKLFYIQGYAATTVKDIVTDAKSKLGLFTYYFDGKEAVAIDIFKDFVNDIALVLEVPLKALYDQGDFLLIDIVEYRCYFRGLCAGPEIKRFYSEISASAAFAQMTIELKDYFIERLHKSGLIQGTNPMIRDQVYLEAVSSLTSGMEIQFFKDLVDGKLDIDYDDAIDFFLTEYYRFLINDRSLVMNKLREGRKMAEALQLEIGEGFTVRLH